MNSNSRTCVSVPTSRVNDVDRRADDTVGSVNIKHDYALVCDGNKTVTRFVRRMDTTAPPHGLQMYKLGAT